MSEQPPPIDRRAFLASCSAAALGAATVGAVARPRAFAADSIVEKQGDMADVVIYGGTSAGVVAAVMAARLGRTVTLIEPGRRLGGMSSEGLGGTDIDNHGDFQNSAAVGGLALEFYRRVADRYGNTHAFDDMLAERKKSAGLWRFEPHIAQEVFLDWVREAGVQVVFGERLAEQRGVDKTGARISRLRCQSGREFAGRTFIDATYEGDLLHVAGCTTTWGREANQQYGESKNGIRGENTYRQFAVRVDPYNTPGNPASGVIATVQDEPFGEPGSADRRIQAYCFRMCLTEEPGNRIPFERPEGYRPDDYEIYRRYAAAGGNLWTPRAGLPNGKTDLGSWHDLSANLYGMNHGYPAGDYADRRAIFADHLRFTQGLCWFLAHDPGVPPAIRDGWSRWGVCRDEFTDHEGWPRQFYVREARRLVADIVHTEHHTRGETPVADPVAVACWPPDTHHVRRIVVDGAAYNEGFVFGGDDWRPFGLSYRSLFPRPDECDNLLTPTCLSSTHTAYGAVRLEWTFMALAQACACAVHVALSQSVSIPSVRYADLRSLLLTHGQVLDPVAVSRVFRPA